MIYLFLVLGLVSADDNWAIILNSSKFWFNYRHTVNALMMYQTLKRYGFSDERIILMLPENIPCHPRNNYPGQIYNGNSPENLYGGNVQVDYKYKDLTPEAITNLLTGRHPPGTPLSKQLRTGPNSKVFFYMNGHGGDSFLKIQDTLVFRNIDLAAAIKEMHLKGRYGEMLIVLDTCQAFSMFNYIDVPNVHAVASSLSHQMAKSFGSDFELGLSTSDHFSFYFHEFFRGKSLKAVEQLNLATVIDKLPRRLIKADIGYRSQSPSASVKLVDYMSSKRQPKAFPSINYKIASVEPFNWEIK